MKISSAFFALIPLVAALPSSTNVVAPIPDVGNVLLCSESNFGGNCMTVHIRSGECTNIPFVAKSFGPDAALTFFLFDQFNCAGNSVGPIISSGQVKPILVGFGIASFRRTLIWFEDKVPPQTLRQTQQKPLKVRLRLLKVQLPQPPEKRRHHGMSLYISYSCVTIYFGLYYSEICATRAHMYQAESSPTSPGVPNLVKGLRRPASRLHDAEDLVLLSKTDTGLPLRIVLAAVIAPIALITLVVATTRILPGTPPQIPDTDTDPANTQPDTAPLPEIAVIEINEDGEVFIPGNLGVAYDQWPDTLRHVRIPSHSSRGLPTRPHLPAMLFLLNGRDETRVAFKYRALGAIARALGQTASTSVLQLNDRTPFEHAPRPTSQFFEAQSGCGFVPADTVGTGA
ncbi:hypothetical protein C8J57DRAFT_1493368 [Mycena rebaudengoi]|nr:hypothetical protein C8J57DRAFT_1493368 [Mycena rebaudengoi]